MASIVELRELDDAKLEQMLEDARESLFKLRFRQASSQIEDYTQIRLNRREIARLETVLQMHRKAIEVAASEPAITDALKGKTWQAKARFDYEESAYQVHFSDESGSKLASAVVDLNKKRVNGRRARNSKPQPHLVIGYEVAG